MVGNGARHDDVTATFPLIAFAGSTEQAPKYGVGLKGATQFLCQPGLMGATWGVN